jgi:phage terminase large subunit-like protein
VTARLVLAGVVPVRPPAEAGDPCPRCGAALVGYRMGDRETVACDGCGFADVTTPLGGDPLVPGEDYGSGSGS